MTVVTPVALFSESCTHNPSLLCTQSDINIYFTLSSLAVHVYPP